MSKATKTIKQALGYQPTQASWFAATKVLFNQVTAFYFDVVTAHPGLLDLDTKAALTALERLTHVTKDNPHPLMPLSAIAGNIPALFRRAAIHAALGSAHSFATHLDKWRRRKEKASAKGKKFTERPPVPPRSWNKSPVLYAGQWKDRAPKHILLKLWTGSSWCWVKCRVSGREFPHGWEAGSPQLVQHGTQWWIHTSLEQQMPSPGKVQTQVTTNQDVKICAVDMNLDTHLAVCTIQTIEGTILATRFIGEGKETYGLRKRWLGRIARNRRKTGILAEGEQDNVGLWAKVRHLDEQIAHQISHHIVVFAKQYDARIPVFEHLGSLRPEKGTFSRRANSKRSYWLKGRIFAYSRYKAWNTGGIVTSRVSPRNTSRDCARCGAPVARYHAGQPAEGYTSGAPLVFCVHCGMKGHADRNASIVIGKRLISRYQTQRQEKPHAPLRAERPAKAGGVAGSQDAESAGRPSTNRARHGGSNEQGTAQGEASRMGETSLGIPHQLRPLR